MFDRLRKLARELVEAALVDPTRKPAPAGPAAPSPAPRREAAPVVVYVEWDSPGKADIEKLLGARGISFKLLPVDHDEATQSWLEATVKRDPPVVFIGPDAIGGLEELKRLDAAGELVRRVFGPGAAATPREPAQPSPPVPAAEPAPAALVQIFGSDSDQWTGRCKILFEQRGVAFQFVDLDDARHAGERERLVEKTRGSVMPYVFVRGGFIGGWNELDELDRLGKLDELLDPSAASSGRSPIKIEIAERPEQSGRDRPS
jgi:glutaredoxin